MSSDVATLTDIERERASLIDARARRVFEHNEWIAKCDARLKVLSERTALLGGGIDLVRVDRALKVLQVRGDPSKPVHGSDSDQHRGGVRSGAIEFAKQCLLLKGGLLKEKYIGVKNYAHFGDQREDHGYNMGPRHGDIVFSIGLVKETRNRDLTPEEIEDALYFLHVWPAVVAAKAQCASAGRGNLARNVGEYCS